MSEITISLLKDMNLSFNLDTHNSTQEFAVLETNFKNADEVQKFVLHIEKETNSKFRIKFEKKNLKRIMLHKCWVCQHSSFRKKPGSKKNAECKSFIDVVIKNMSTTALQKEEGLPCIIKINLNHSHSTVNADALRRLDVDTEMPSIFMTDDSTAEKNALKIVWPSSKQLLCHFHVAQAEWRWLMSNASDVSYEERQVVMKLFQAIMYAKNEDDLQIAYEALNKRVDKNPRFVNRFLKFFERKEEWLAFHRLNKITRNNNTNNICEATIRILKEIVLSRTKAFNVIALIDFIVNIFNKYLTRKLLKHSYNRGESLENLYSDILSKMENVEIKNVITLSNNLYLVPSSTEPNNRYIVNIDIGYCTCLSGKTGAFCKHQCFLMHHLKISLPNAPVLNAMDRQTLAKIALGEECPPICFFETYLKENTDKGLQSKNTNVDEGNVEEHNYENTHLQSDILELEENIHIPSNALLGEEENKNASEEDKEKFLNEIKRLMTFNANKTNLLKVTKCLKTIHNENILNEKLIKLKAVFRSKRRRNINVQPTSVSRRKIGSSKRSTSVPAGRPCKLNINNKNRKKKHSLKKSIEENASNSKK